MCQEEHVHKLCWMWLLRLHHVMDTQCSQAASRAATGGPLARTCPARHVHTVGQRAVQHALGRRQVCRYVRCGEAGVR